MSAVPSKFVLTIANGATTSGSKASNTFLTTRGMTIYGPAALTGTVTVQVSHDVAGATWYALNTGGADVAVTAVKAVHYPNVGGFAAIRLFSGAAEGAQRDVTIVLMGDPQ